MHRSSLSPTEKSYTIVSGIHPPKSTVKSYINQGALIANKQNPNEIVNAFPLFHTPIVNPTFVIALDLIESNLSPNE